MNFTCCIARFSSISKPLWWGQIVRMLINFAECRAYKSYKFLWKNKNQTTKIKRTIWFGVITDKCERLYCAIHDLHALFFRTHEPEVCRRRHHHRHHEQHFSTRTIEISHISCKQMLRSRSKRIKWTRKRYRKKKKKKKNKSVTMLG